MSDLPVSAIAEINPAVQVPTGLRSTDLVSFIPMSDVSESGRWVSKGVRSLSAVGTGFTSFQEGDVLVAKITPCMENGKGAHAVGLASGIGFGSTEFHVLRARPGNSSRFVFHLSQWRELRNAAEGQMLGSAGQQRVPRKFFDEFRLVAFDDDQQTMVAGVLDVIGTAIHETETIIAKLKAVKQGLLQDLLTRGIDANGELRPPQAEAPHLYKQSSLGWIPTGWTVAPLEKLLAPIDPAMRSGPFGSALLKHELVEVGHPLLGIDNVHVEHFASDYTRFVSSPKFVQLARYAVRPSDLMITIMGTVGRCCLVPEDVGLALSSKHTWTITLDQDAYSPYLAMLQVNYSPWVLGHFARDQQGGTMAAIRSETLRSTLLPVPPREEQCLMEERMREVSRRIDFESEALKKMRVKKSGLMDDLLTGRVRVTPLLNPPPA